MTRAIALTLEEVYSLIGDQIAGQILRSVDTANNERAVEISALPEFNQAWLLLSLLQLDRATHHCHGVSWIVSCTGAAKAADSFLCIREAALACEPPWRFWSDEHEDGKWCGEHPLKSDWHSGALISTMSRDSATKQTNLYAEEFG